jgi:hypothetical protein
MNTMFIKKTPQPLPGLYFTVMRLDPQEKNVIHHNMPTQPANPYETHN